MYMSVQGEGICNQIYTSSWRPEEEARAGVTGGCDYGYWELNLGPFVRAVQALNC